MSKTTESTVAVIDIGTNSSKLVVARGAPATRAVSTEAFVRETTRIGAGLESTGRITNDALVRTINTLERFRVVFQRYDCDGVYVYSTHALRKAENADDVVRKIENETGIRIKVLTEAEEANFAYLSARTRFGNSRSNTYLIDVGGGSTEFVYASPDRIITSASLPLGALHLTEKFIKTDPVSEHEFNGLREKVVSAVSRLFRDRVQPNIAPGQVDFFTSGGSATTIKEMIAAGGTTVRTSVLAGTTDKIRIGDARRLLKLCRELPAAKRKRLPGLDPAWADIIVAGLSVVITFMEAAKKRVMRINEGGVREGVALHVIQNSLQW